VLDETDNRLSLCLLKYKSHINLFTVHDSWINPRLSSVCSRCVVCLLHNNLTYYWKKKPILVGNLTVLIFSYHNIKEHSYTRLGKLLQKALRCILESYLNFVLVQSIMQPVTFSTGMCGQDTLWCPFPPFFFWQNT
jgi:hypothetical protein